MEDELIAQLALEQIHGLGNKNIKSLISYCGSASQVFRETKGKLLKIPGIGEKSVQELKASNSINSAKSIIDNAKKIGAEIIHYTNLKYPWRLKQIPDAPNFLFKKGNGSLDLEKIVAIVGTRKATTYGKHITEQIVEELKPFNPLIVSGLAYGIDIQAHKSSIKENISTYGVLAGGLDKIYPSSHKKFVNEMIEKGGIISESIPGTKPDPHLFPARNRIIAGLSDAVIIVEAAEKGGALITGNLADSYNRPVFAVPGNLGNTYSSGTNRLIASQKAIIYNGIEDLIYHLNWDIQDEKAKKEYPKLEGEEKVVWEYLHKSGCPIEIDNLSIQTNVSIQRIASVLLSLEFKGHVKCLPGKNYQAI